MFGVKQEKFRSIRSYPSVLQVRDSERFDFSEFTKSEREKSSETLVDWRSRNGWQVAKKPLTIRKQIAVWIAIHTLFIFASLLGFHYFR